MATPTPPPGPGPNPQGPYPPGMSEPPRRPPGRQRSKVFVIIASVLLVLIGLPAGLLGACLLVFAAEGTGFGKADPMTGPFGFAFLMVPVLLAVLLFFALRGKKV